MNSLVITPVAMPGANKAWMIDDRMLILARSHDSSGLSSLVLGFFFFFSFYFTVAV